MRWRVDTKFGYISFAECDERKAFVYYQESGIRLRRCKDIFDEGVVVAGQPIIEDCSDYGEHYPKGAN